MACGICSQAWWSGSHHLLFWEEIEAKDEEIAAAVKKHEDFVETLQKQYEEHAIWRDSPS